MPKKIPSKKQKTSKKKIILFPDTSVFYSLLDEADKHHTSCDSLFGFLRAYKDHVEWYVNFLVIAETISKLCKKKEFTVAKSIKLIEGLLGKGSMLRGGRAYDINEVFERYNLFSKKKFSQKLKTNDFYIATEGLLVGAIILTCDIAFYRNIKKSYEDIFFVSNESSKEKSQIGKLIKKIEECTK